MATWSCVLRPASCAAKDHCLSFEVLCPRSYVPHEYAVAYGASIIGASLRHYVRYKTAKYLADCLRKMTAGVYGPFIHDSFDAPSPWSQRVAAVNRLLLDQGQWLIS